VVQVKDARSLSPEGQEALRQRGVRAVLSGMKQTAAARTFGVARGPVARWVRQYRNKMGGLDDGTGAHCASTSGIRSDASWWA
jgi:transposase-like protein